jgi:peptide chain release factor
MMGKTMKRHVIVISSGYGPVEVRQFVARLAQRIESVCEQLGLLLEEVVVHGDENAPGSVELFIGGDEVLLTGELGTHALVARSDFRGKASRKRWYASVTRHDAAPLADSVDLALDPRDLEITAMRASGPGGQNVNKTSTAVRIRHLPSGLVVRVADERSQKSNLRQAMARLTWLLRDRENRNSAKRETQKWATHARLERGFPVRTYTLSPRGELCVAPNSQN